MANIDPAINSWASNYRATAESRGRAGVTISERETLGLAAVLVRRGQSMALAERVRQRFHIELPQGPYRTTAADLALIATGPGAWLATREQGWRDTAGLIRAVIGDLASISEQSDAYIVLRLCGPRVRDTLAKMVPVDLHPTAFTCGAVALTSAGHMGVMLWRLDDEAATARSVFEIAVNRSVAADFCRFLSDSAAEFTLARSDANDPESSRAEAAA